MSVFDDPRVTKSAGVSDEAYDIRMGDGTWDVVQVEPGQFVAVPPGPFLDGVDETAGLPRFASAELAVGSVLA